ncbi:MAG: hypothetical protein J6T84_01930 [Spirochaetaceae bacterium]|nr:hypothetical protein [Spirochaetaceae bacterium]
MKKNAKQLFNDLLAKSTNEECRKSVRQLQSALDLFDRNYPCIDEQLFSKIVRKIMTIKSYFPESQESKELSKIQGYYHRRMNRQPHALDIYFEVDDFGSCSDDC